MSFCPSCGADTGDTARFCPKCGTGLGVASPAPKKKRTLLKVVVVLFGLFILLAIIGSLGDNHTAPTADSQRNALPLGVTDDASLLVARCGQPSSDDSTAYDNPRPPIPSRTIEYRKQKLRFLFVPGFGATMGDSPPYRWKLVGTTDMTASDPSKARVVMPSEAVTRMPCWQPH
jgi:hypothetical protein